MGQILKELVTKKDYSPAEIPENLAVSHKICADSRTLGPADNLDKKSDCSAGQQQQFSDTAVAVELNSYKFARPRIYVSNDYPDSEISRLERLRNLVLTVGPKKRPEQYNALLTRLLRLSLPLPKKKGEKIVEVKLNSMTASPSLKLAALNLEGLSVYALADTGSSHCLLTVETFSRLENALLLPVKVTMKVAGSVMNDNVIGKTTMTVVLMTEQGDKVPFELSFYVAHVLNGYDAILGADFLMNEDKMSAITPSNLIVKAGNADKCIPLLEQSAHAPQLNHIVMEQSAVIPADSSVQVKLKLPGWQSDSNGTVRMLTALADKDKTTLVDLPGCLTPSHRHADSVRFHNLSVNKSDKTLTGTVTNLSAEDRILPADSVALTLNASKLKAKMSARHSFQESDSCLDDTEPDSIEEKILAENTLIDSSAMDKMFSHKDCEINPKISTEIQQKLRDILTENQEIGRAHV